MKFRMIFCLLLVLTSHYSLAKDREVTATDKGIQLAITEFSQMMAKDFGFEQAVIESQLASLKPRKDIIAKITRPAEAMPWYKYRQIWMKPKRIQAGVDFWEQHRATLSRAEKVYGVDSAIIVSILGVETFFGRVQGDFPVIEALYTLGFHYPKRAEFFRSELAQYLILAREQGWQLEGIKGSYAGAMGMGQFISSSYRHYGVDFNQDGKVNLFDDPEDMIGSVANYFSKHHWQQGHFVAEKVKGNKAAQKVVQTSLELEMDLAAIESYGIQLSEAAKMTNRLGIFAFEKSKNRKDYWAVGDNFYSITRYNRSPLYALAVFQLSEAIKVARDERLASTH